MVNRDAFMNRNVRFIREYTAPIRKEIKEAEEKFFVRQPIAQWMDELLKALS